MTETHFYQSGDVTIHTGAAIAPGVLLQADPGSQLVIAPGVCIGAGAVLHAQQGMLEIGEGATLGSGVLVVGSVRIGAKACIGSMATIFNCAVAPMQVIPAGALIAVDGLGDDLPSSLTAASETVAPEAAVPLEPSLPTEAKQESTATASVNSSSSVSTSQVYGRVAFERLMVSLFPQKQSLNGMPQDPSSPTEPSTQ